MVAAPELLRILQLLDTGCGREAAEAVHRLVPAPLWQAVVPQLFSHLVSGKVRTRVSVFEVAAAVVHNKRTPLSCLPLAPLRSLRKGTRKRAPRFLFKGRMRDSLVQLSSVRLQEHARSIASRILQSLEEVVPAAVLYPALAEQPDTEGGFSVNAQRTVVISRQEPRNGSSPSRLEHLLRGVGAFCRPSRRRQELTLTAHPRPFVSITASLQYASERRSSRRKNDPRQYARSPPPPGVPSFAAPWDRPSGWRDRFPDTALRRQWYSFKHVWPIVEGTRRRNPRNLMSSRAPTKSLVGLLPGVGQAMCCRSLVPRSTASRRSSRFRLGGFLLHLYERTRGSFPRLI